MRRLGAAALALGAGLLLPGPAPAGLGEDLARCQASVWPRFAGWSLSHQQGPDSPRTADDFYCLALGHWSGQTPFPGKDPVKSAGHARTAAEQNHAGAQGLLGFFHDRGIGVKAEFDGGVRLYKAGQQTAAAKLFLKAAELGHARAQLQIGYQYNYGEGVPASAPQAVKWYAKAAAQGDPTAQANLGDMYEHGTGTREDWVEAARWYAKSAARDNAGGLFRLGRAYQFGIGVPQNREQEEAHVIAGRVRTGLLWEEPVGVLFHSSAERLAYIRNLRYRVDRYEAYQAWVLRRNEYDDCKRASRSSCSDPGPAPP